MTPKPTITQQIAAAWLGHNVLTGQKAPSAKERAYAAPHAEAAARTLEWVRDNEDWIKGYRREMAKELPQGAEPTREYLAVELLRRARVELPSGFLGDEIGAFLIDVDGAAR